MVLVGINVGSKKVVQLAQNCSNTKRGVVESD